MIKRLWIITTVIFAGLCGLCLLGLHSLSLHADGLQGRRMAEFTAVAEQIRTDVKRKLDQFIQNEQKRPYTDYQYYYVPIAANMSNALVRSPLGDNPHHGLAFGYFQIEPDGGVVNPYIPMEQIETAPLLVQNYLNNDIKENLLSRLNVRLSPDISALTEKVQSLAKEQQKIAAENESLQEKTSAKAVPQTKGMGGSRSEYRIDTLDQSQQVQVVNQSRANVEWNTANTDPGRTQFDSGQIERQRQDYSQQGTSGMGYGEQTQQSIGAQSDPQTSRYQQQEDTPAQIQQPQSRISQQRETSRPQGRLWGRGSVPAQQQMAQMDNDPLATEGMSDYGFQQDPLATRQIQQPAAQQAMNPNDLVQVRIEPFVPIMMPDGDGAAVFGEQVFLVRHVQIEQKHFLQGFRLNQNVLVEEVRESASRLMRRGMGYEIAPKETALSGNITHTAILDFGFGSMALGLLEQNPRWLAGEIATLRDWYFAIMSVVFAATVLALLALWNSARAQLKLARKKDDFISAVSHELRTPLTSIRMYTEMLEKGWVKTDDKRGEYYSTMRQETERLSRLIENVLDFSRIQRGRKKYVFQLGNVNTCIDGVIDMMAPCAQRAGFLIEKDFGPVPPFAFDADAVMQIVINLLDNALKYARDATEKIVTVRTRLDNNYVLIEVEDHGPGIPRMQRKKVFDEFYRIGEESRRETTGTGLGLALVKRFAQAHNGFVEILSAKPTGAILRVALTVQTD
ncbi:MAG: HAMP domain-containing histidine kinase [Sedimentisphaerales bacterium]|nr:HAMP domain-containing histidine kinase [Sedimentisphaerales bacterium]